VAPYFFGRLDATQSATAAPAAHLGNPPRATKAEMAAPKAAQAHRDATVIQRFSSDQANLFHVSPANPRRSLQLRYLNEITKLAEVPEKMIVERVSPAQLSLDEAMFLVRLRSILLDEYFMPDVDLALATISHGVAIHVEKKETFLNISIARDMPAVRMVVESYRSAREVFQGFAIDFVRQHLYPQIRDHVPSSTRQGRDALYRRLKENEELFRLELGDYGDMESLLADYLVGKVELEQVLRTSGGRGAGQRQEVRRDQVGTVEQEMPDIIDSLGEAEPRSEFEATPPIQRPDMVSEMKVTQPPAPFHAIARGFAGPSLLAMMLVAKYANHQPLNRQSEQ